MGKKYMNIVAVILLMSAMIFTPLDSYATETFAKNLFDTEEDSSALTEVVEELVAEEDSNFFETQITVEENLVDRDSEQLKVEETAIIETDNFNEVASPQKAVSPPQQAAATKSLAAPTNTVAQASKITLENVVVVVKDEYGKDIAGVDVNQYTNINVEINFSLPNNSVKAGDFSEIELPPALKFERDEEFPVMDGSNKVAHAYVSVSDKKITLVYESYPENKSNVTGELQFNTRIDTRVVETDRIVEFQLKINDVVVTYMNMNYGWVGDDPDERFSKYLWFVDNTPNILQNVIRINPSKKSYTDLTVYDELQTEGLTFVEGSFNFYKGTWAMDAKKQWQFTRSETLNPNLIQLSADGKSFTVNIGKVEPQDQYRIEYQVDINRMPKPQEGFANTVIFTDSQKESWTQRVEERYQGASGSANGINFTIKLKKVDEANSNLKLEGAEFKVIRDRTNAVVATLTTDSNGEAVTGELLKDKYTIIEVTPPTGYEKSDTEIAVLETEFDTTLEVLKTITNKKISSNPPPEKISIEVTKNWDDDNNRDGIRPSEVTVILLDGTNEIKRDVIKALEDWKYSFTNLDKFRNGQEIIYTIDEVAVSKYTSKIEGFKITNSYTPEKTTATVKKEWSDDNNRDGIRPASIEVQLYADNVAVGQQVTLSASQNWSYTWEDLPKNVNVNGDVRAIAYTVKEVSVVEGYTTSTETDNSTTIITNSYTPEKTSAKVTKVWSDDNNRDGIRPASIEVQLYADGVAGQKVTLSAENDWEYTWTGLNAKAAGQPIVYTVKEVSVVEGYTTSTETDNSTTIITNSYTPEKTSAKVTKVWSDDNNRDGIRPASIEVQLYADDVAVEKVTLSANQNWSHTWGDLPKNVNVNGDVRAIVYTVKEVELPTGYTANYVMADKANMVITNTYIPGKTSATVKKVWADDNNRDGIRPASIEVQLYADDVAVEKVTLSAENNWEYTWTGLNAKANGQPIVYTVKEVGVVEGYTSSTEMDQTTTIITNTHQPEKTSAKVTKVWSDVNDFDGIRPASIEVQLLANDIPSGSPVTLNAANRWTYTWTNLYQKADGKEIKYTVKEVAVPGGYYVAYHIDNVADMVITNVHSPYIPQPEPEPQPTEPEEPQPEPEPEPTEPEEEPEPQPTEPEEEPSPNTDTEGEETPPAPVPTPSPNPPTYEDYLKWLEEQSKTPSYESYLEWMQEQSKTPSYEDYINWLEENENTPSNNGVRPNNRPKLPQTNGLQNSYYFVGLLLALMGITLLTAKYFRRKNGQL